jgi:hypothetical protein
MSLSPPSKLRGEYVGVFQQVGVVQEVRRASSSSGLRRGPNTRIRSRRGRWVRDRGKHRRPSYGGVEASERRIVEKVRHARRRQFSSNTRDKRYNVRRITLPDPVQPQPLLYSPSTLPSRPSSISPSSGRTWCCRRFCSKRGGHQSYVLPDVIDADARLTSRSPPLNRAESVALRLGVLLA